MPNTEDVFVVGTQREGDQRGEILEYDGVEWTVSDFYEMDLFQDVWGSSPADIYAVGWFGLFDYDGINWTQQIAGRQLQSVWGSGPTDVLVVGFAGRILHYDGTQWTEQESGTTKWLRGVLGFSPRNVIAVGTNGTILRYDGSE